MDKSYRLRKNQLLRRGNEIKRILDEGRRYAGRGMVIVVRPASEAVRVGFRASRNVGGSVKRSRARRILREIFRLNQWRFSGTFDLVCIARQNLLCYTFAQNELEFIRLLKKARCIKNGEPEG